MLHESLPILELHDSTKATVSKGFQYRHAGLLRKAGHPVVFAALLCAWAKVHRISRVDGWVLIKVVMGPQEDATPISHCYRVGDILSVGDVEEASGHPGNQVLQAHFHNASFKVLQLNYPIILWLYAQAGYISTHLIFNAFVVFNVPAEVYSWSPDIVLTVQTAAGLLYVLMLGDGNLIPGDRQDRQRRMMWDSQPRPCS